MPISNPRVLLVPLATPEEQAHCRSLRVQDDQFDFVATNAESLQEAAESPWCQPLAIRAADSGEMVGFLMHALDPDENSRWIYRLMIDQQYQGRGYGRAALRAAVALLRDLPGGPGVALGVVPENTGARQLYAAEGFVETGEIIGRELVMRLSPA